MGTRPPDLAATQNELVAIRYGSDGRGEIVRFRKSAAAGPAKLAAAISFPGKKLKKD
jgi:hypothetical protein